MENFSKRFFLISVLLLFFVLFKYTVSKSAPTTETYLSNCKLYEKPEFVSTSDVYITNEVVRNWTEMQCGLNFMQVTKNKKTILSVIFRVIALPKPIETDDPLFRRRCSELYVSIGSEVGVDPTGLLFHTKSTNHTFMFPCAFDLRKAVSFQFEEVGGAVITLTEAVDGLEYAPSHVWFRAIFSAGYRRKPGEACEKGYFICAKTDMGCYPEDYLCDGVENCLSGMDEMNCSG